MGNQKFDRSKKGGSTPDKGDYLRAGKDPEVMENVAEAEKKGRISHKKPEPAKERIRRHKKNLLKKDN